MINSIPRIHGGPACKRCKFHDTVKRGDPTKEIECRRYPPTSIPFVDPQGRILWGSGFPARSIDDWCGEYIPQLALQQ